MCVVILIVCVNFSLGPIYGTLNPNFLTYTSRVVAVTSCTGERHRNKITRSFVTEIVSHNPRCNCFRRHHT